VMSDVLRRVKEGRSLSERIASYIPGYRGYKEKELRREADRLIREHLLRRLEPAYRDFKSNMLAVAASGDPALMSVYNQTQALFDRVISKLRTASYGYSGFFDAVKIRERELDRMLEYDWGLIQAVEELASAARAVAAAEPSKLPDALGNLRSKLLSFEELLIKREEVIRGVVGEI
ncbi:MAG: hypothetical protein QW394_02525, partial [Thermofilaceae archaeon]